MTDPSIYVTGKAGPHHVVTSEPPHHEDDCIPECPLNAATDNRGAPVSTFTVPPSGQVQQPVPVTLHLSDGVSMDVTSAQRAELADGTVTALVTWEEWPREGSAS